MIFTFLHFQCLEGIENDGTSRCRRKPCKKHGFLDPPGRARRALSPLAPGFTLLEMLVVVVLVGIIATMVTLALGARGNRSTETEASQLAAACNYAEDAAVLSGRPRGVVLALDGYAVVQFDGKRWLLDGAGRQRHVPPPLHLESDRLWPSLDEVSRTPRPQVLFLPSGEQQLPLVALNNTASGERFLLQVNEEGRIFAVAEAR